MSLRLMVVGPHPRDLCLRRLRRLGLARGAYLLTAARASLSGSLIPNPYFVPVLPAFFFKTSPVKRTPFCL
jgi:hypothetical protein